MTNDQSTNDHLTQATMFRIAIIEDDSEYRQFLRSITEQSGKYTCFGAYSNGEIFLEAV
jgi:CheY-like chemotaxis protein